MSIACCIPVLECVYCLACARWAVKRCLHSGSHDSETWGLSSAVEFAPVPRLCRYILAVYEEDIDNPQWAPPGGYGIDTRYVVVRKNYVDNSGRAPPYLIYVDHKNSDIVLAIRGFNFSKEGDYAVLLDNRLGKRKFDGGYVHNGLLTSAVWVFDAECRVLAKLLEQNPDYTLTFAGHSLGSGVAALATMVAVQNLERLGNVERKRIRCFAMAPARCVSLNLAVRYADVINSVVLQDDFLPRTSTPLEDLFHSVFCLPCLLCFRCMIDTCIPEHTMLRDPRRLYAPGRLYHIVEKKPFRCGKYPPVVKTAIPVDGRFEQIVLTRNATTDHGIIWIERESKMALDLMLEKERVMQVPDKQRMEQEKLVSQEHREQHQAALQRAVTLAVPDASVTSQYGTFNEESPSSGTDGHSSHKESPSSGTDGHSSPPPSGSSKPKLTWTEWIKRVFEKDDSGELIIRGSTTSTDGS